MKSLREKVYALVKKIPKGEVKTYKEIAETLNTSPRAVARILSQNPYPIKIPCHRVIRSDGRIGGYTFKGKRKDGMKISLLRKEGIKIINGKIKEKIT